MKTIWKLKVIDYCLRNFCSPASIIKQIWWLHWTFLLFKQKRQIIPSMLIIHCVLRQKYFDTYFFYFSFVKLHILTKKILKQHQRPKLQMSNTCIKLVNTEINTDFMRIYAYLFIIISLRWITWYWLKLANIFLVIK